MKNNDKEFSQEIIDKIISTKVKTLDQIETQDGIIGEHKKFLPPEFKISSIINMQLQKESDTSKRRNDMCDFKKPYAYLDRRFYQTYNFTTPDHPIRFGYFKSKSGYTERGKNTEDFQDHYGEYVSSIILRQLGLNSCKVSLGTAFIRRPFAKERMQIEGCLSHSQTSDNEYLVFLVNLLDGFRKTEEYEKNNYKHIFNTDPNLVDFEESLLAIKRYFECNDSEDRYADMRKEFFDMCLFDIKFANTDRNNGNLGVRIAQLDDGSELLEPYPLFDNEEILGFGLASAKGSDEEAENNYRKLTTTRIVYSDQDNKRDSNDLFKYLLENYYEETMQSYARVSRYKLEDLDELFNRCGDISEGRRSLAKKIFEKKEKDMQLILARENYKRQQEGKPVVVINSKDRCLDSKDEQNLE